MHDTLIYEYVTDNGAANLAALCESDKGGKAAYPALLAVLGGSAPLAESQTDVIALAWRYLAYREIDRLATRCRNHLRMQSVFTNKTHIKSIIYSLTP